MYDATIISIFPFLALSWTRTQGPVDLLSNGTPSAVNIVFANSAATPTMAPFSFHMIGGYSGCPDTIRTSRAKAGYTTSTMLTINKIIFFIDLP